MKKLLFLFALLVAAVSCSQEEEFDTAEVSAAGEPIKFAVVDDAVTRGAIETSISEFEVYAVDGSGNVIISDATFTKDKTTGSWSTDATFYWTGSTIYFYAFVGCSDFVQDGTTLKYTMPSDVTAQTDMMVASCEASSGTVSFKFAHIMSFIKFSVTREESTYYVASVALSGMADSGVYDMSTGTWGSTSSTGASYAAGIDETVVDGQITVDTGYIIILPQTAPSITIDAETANGLTKNYDLSDVTWEKNKVYNYTINIDGIEPAEPAVKTATLCFKDYNDLSVAYYSTTSNDNITSMYEQIQIYDAEGYTYYKICCTPTKSTGNRSFPFVDFDTEDVTLDLTDVSGMGSKYSTSGLYYWDSNYFCHAGYTGSLSTLSSINLNNIAKLITPTDITAFSSSIYAMANLKEVIITSSSVTTLKYAFYNCPSLEAISITGYTSSPSSYIDSTAFSGTTVTANITLTLGSSQISNVSGNTWGGRTWKEIIIE